MPKKNEVSMKYSNKISKQFSKQKNSSSSQGRRPIQDFTTSSHPDHSNVLTRLKKIKGQIEGIEQMIHDRRYCVDILTQLKASSSALRSIEGVVLKSHLRGCVQSALLLKDETQVEHKIEEMVKLAVRS